MAAPASISSDITFYHTIQRGGVSTKQTIYPVSCPRLVVHICSITGTLSSERQYVQNWTAY